MDLSRASGQHHDRQAARARLQRLDERLRAARQLHQAGANLARYYGPRPLRPVRLAELLAEGRWAA